MAPRFTYGPSLFIREGFPAETLNYAKSAFDDFLQTLWKQASDSGVCRYKLGKVATKVLPGKYKFVAQLNVDRVQKRRKPQDVTTIKMEFDPELFNFTKIKENELLFDLEPTHWSCGEPVPVPSHSIIINVSPLEFCNSLLAPHRSSCHPQLLTGDALRLALETVFLSATRAYRTGFNSLGGFASVNHLHIHLYYLHYQLYLETAAARQLSGPCYTLQDYPVPAFVFQSCPEDIEQTVAQVMKVVELIHKLDISYNLFLTRGIALDSASPVVRIYVYPRNSCFGVKDEDAFNPAMCELSGHLLVKSQQSFETISEENACKQLQDTVLQQFNRLSTVVAELFT